MDCPAGGIVVDADVLNMQQSSLPHELPGFPSVCAWISDAGFLRAIFAMRSLRKRGLAISSIPKLTKASPAPRMAMHNPGGRNHHQAPNSSASLFPAQ